MLTGLLSPSLARFRLWNCTSVCCWKGVAKTISLLQWKCDLGPLLNFEAIFMRWRRTGRILRVGRWPNEAWYYCIKVRNGCTSHRFSRLVICSAWILCCKIEVGSSFRVGSSLRYHVLCRLVIGFTQPVVEKKDSISNPNRTDSDGQIAGWFNTEKKP